MTLPRHRLIGMLVATGVHGCGVVYGPCLEPGATGPPPDGEPGDCIQLYDPVCGCDGETYSNSCFAGLAGVTVVHEGPCNLLDQVLLPPR